MSSAQFADRVGKYWEKMGRLKLWSGVLGMQALQASQQETQKNREAESRYARRKAWGETGEEASEDMGHVYLGDIQQPSPPVIVAGQSSGLGQLIGAALVGASMLGIPGAGVAAYLYGKAQNEPAKPSVEVIEQREDLGLGLLKLEDLKQ